MSRSYFPENDRALKDWFINFVTVLSNNLATFGLVAADVTPLDTDVNAFDGALTNYFAQQTLMASASSQKKETKTAAIATLRPLVQRIQSHPAMTDALRSLLGLPERGGGNIVLSETPLPLLKPLVALEPGQGQVIVHWGPEPGNERINGKPAGVKGAVICRKKLGEADFQMIGYATSSPFVDYVSGNAADYVYMVRYRGTKPTDVSEWSDEHTVAARGAQAA